MSHAQAECSTTHDPCVCVYSELRESGYTENSKEESKDGGVCENAHTAFFAKVVTKCSSVVNHFASRKGVETPQSASTLLALWRRS